MDACSTPGREPLAPRQRPARRRHAGQPLRARRRCCRPLGARLVEAQLRRGGARSASSARRSRSCCSTCRCRSMDGFEVGARGCARSSNGRELPIIFLTAIHRDEAFVRRATRSGAADYITKPFDADVLRARVKAFVDLFQQREEVRRAQVALRTQRARRGPAPARRVRADRHCGARHRRSRVLPAGAARDLPRGGGRRGLRLRSCSATATRSGARGPRCRRGGGRALLRRVGEGFAGGIAASRQPLESRTRRRRRSRAEPVAASRGTRRALRRRRCSHDGERPRCRAHRLGTRRRSRSARSASSARWRSAPRGQCSRS